MITRQQFYKSKQWEALRQVIIAERTQPDGFIYCDHCGKPILKKYDLILHHKIELDDLNVNDVSISLNSNNIECIHFKCHNEIHNRFQGGDGGRYKPIPKHVYIVYGSPCSGKTTWVHANATANDLVVDMDSIWQMISINDRYTKPHALRSVSFDIRDKLYDIIKYRSGKWTNAFVIVGGALKGDRDRLAQRIGSDEFIYIECEKKICLERLQKRSDMNDVQKEDWKTFIDDWFAKYQSD